MIPYHYTHSRPPCPLPPVACAHSLSPPPTQPHVQAYHMNDAYSHQLHHQVANLLVMGKCNCRNFNDPSSPHASAPIAGVPQGRRIQPAVALPMVNLQEIGDNNCRDYKNPIPTSPPSSSSSSCVCVCVCVCLPPPAQDNLYMMMVS